MNCKLILVYSESILSLEIDVILESLQKASDSLFQPDTMGLWPPSKEEFRASDLTYVLK